MSLDKEKLFREFGEGLLDSRISKAIAKLGYIHPTLVQSKFIPIALKGKDILTRARTGSGKTFAYAVPTVQKVLLSKQNEDESAKRSIRAVILVPSKELCHQTFLAIQQLLYYCSDIVSICELGGQAMGVQKVQLRECPDIVVSTPGRLVAHIHAKSISLKETVETFVIDEADMILSFGYKNDLDRIISDLPNICQTFLMSATLSPELDDFRHVVLHKPAILKLEGGDTDGNLAQFFVEIDEKDKDLLLYALLKLKLVSGRILFFVNSVARCYRLKLLLEQFVVRSAVLNAELPVRSRQSIIEQFNKGIFDHLIATDNSLAYDDEDSDEEDEDEDTEVDAAERKRRSKETRDAKKEEFGVARGIDFRGVNTVVNIDFPADERSYTHRIGRTARGGAAGTALTLLTRGSATEAALLEEIQSTQAEVDGVKQPQRLPLDVAEIEGMRYRVNDVSRAVTRVAIKEARLQELKQELLNSEKLQEHFQNNPHDAAVLHDQHLRPASIKHHMATLPDYLIPAALQGQNDRGSGSGRAKRRGGERKRKKRDEDPLQTFSYSVEKLSNAQSKAARARPRAKVIARQSEAGVSTAGRRKWKERHDKQIKKKRRRRQRRK